MQITSEHFIVRSLAESDKDEIKAMEESRPWAKAFDKFSKELKAAGKKDADINYFETLWELYQESEYFWVIESVEKGFAGDIQLDIDSETEACFYIHMKDKADLKGFGKEMLHKVMRHISSSYGIEEIYVSLWDEKDPCKEVFEEAGYEFEEGYLEISI